MKLTIDKQGGRFVVDEPAALGSPWVGRGRTMTEAMGDFFRKHQREFGVEFEVLPSALASEIRRRNRELRKR